MDKRDVPNVGIPTEIKDGECRVGLDPEHVGKLIKETGAMVFVESGAGLKAFFTDAEYRQNGACVVANSFDLYACSSWAILKVKELQSEEYKLVRDYQGVAGFFHLPANHKLEAFVKEKGLRTLPYEDQTDDMGRRPILAAMSKIAGREGAQRGFDYLVERHNGQVVPSCVQALIIGKGNVGKAAAAQLKLKKNGVLGWNIRILDVNQTCLDPNSGFSEGLCNQDNVWQAIVAADIVIGAAASLRQGAPKVITEEMVKKMPQGAVLVDVSNDEGGLSETSSPTSHSEPTFEKFGVLHYCVPNIPGGKSVAHEATRALSAAAYPYIVNFMKTFK